MSNFPCISRGPGEPVQRLYLKDTILVQLIFLTLKQLILWTCAFPEPGWRSGRNYGWGGYLTAWQSLPEFFTCTQLLLCGCEHEESTWFSSKTKGLNPQITKMLDLSITPEPKESKHPFFVGSWSESHPALCDYIGSVLCTPSAHSWCCNKSQKLGISPNKTQTLLKS